MRGWNEQSKTEHMGVRKHVGKSSTKLKDDDDRFKGKKKRAMDKTDDWL